MAGGGLPCTALPLLSACVCPCTNAHISAQPHTTCASPVAPLPPPPLLQPLATTAVASATPAPSPINTVVAAPKSKTVRRPCRAASC